MTSPATLDLPLDAPAQFRREVATLPQLSETEEAHLWARPASDQAARVRLVEGYQPLVLALAQRLQHRCHLLEPLDLAQEGTIGLLLALNARERRSETMPLRVWASCWIRSAMLQAIYRNERVLRLPDRTRKSLRRLTAAQVALLGELGREATTDELATRLGSTAQEVTYLLMLQAERFVSLDAQLDGDDAPRFIGAHERSTPHAIDDTPQVQQWVWDVVQQLPERERAVITLRYGFDGEAPKSTHAVATLLDLPQNVVQDIDRRVRLRIRVMMERFGLAPNRMQGASSWSASGQ